MDRYNGPNNMNPCNSYPYGNYQPACSPNPGHCVRSMRQGNGCPRNSGYQPQCTRRTINCGNDNNCNTSRGMPNQCRPSYCRQPQPPQPNYGANVAMGACYGNGSGFNVNGASCMLGQNSPQMQTSMPSTQCNGSNQNCNRNRNVACTGGTCVKSPGQNRVHYNSGDYVSDETFDAMDLLILDQLISTSGTGVRAGMVQSGPMACAICLQDMTSQSLTSTSCGHLFCTECINQALRSSNQCPMCKKTVELNTLRRIYLPARN